MGLNQNETPYYDGRNLEELAERIVENQKGCRSVVVKPDIPEGTTFQLRYPHPFEEVVKH
ncbi:hypothetical protein V7128_17360 [Neobacillus vireti]|uniref:hypothetical protein n=1 Tax=Neobacillus vireti TaxID=220686 RepID=UPI002FFEC2BE